jgi:hypothetical protein
MSKDADQIVGGREVVHLVPSLDRGDERRDEAGQQPRKAGHVGSIRDAEMLEPVIWPAQVVCDEFVWTRKSFRKSEAQSSEP